jgi:release factor glutamine methyltransferase
LPPRALRHETARRHEPASHFPIDGLRSVSDALAGRSIETVRRVLTKQFDAAGVESAALDARILLGAVLALDLTGLIASAARRITSAEAAQIEAFARRRISGEPVARIVGHKEFWGLRLRLSAATLVPRPDTETVVELAIESMRARPSTGALRLADIGTGSGAILLALLHEWPDAIGVGTDISLCALQTARRNAADLDLAPRALFVACDQAAALSGAFDVIVSNPPYIHSSEIASLAREVRDHDPVVALDGGADGLDAYRALIPQAERLLNVGGTLVLEVGQGQSNAVEALMTAAGLSTGCPPKSDLAGVPRAVLGRKTAS